METIKVYQTENDYYKDMQLFGKLKYIGKTFYGGYGGLSNGKIYNCVGCDEKGWLQIVDDSDEDYCYSATSPRPLDGSSEGGKWEPIEIYDDGLQKLFDKISTQK